MQYPLFAAAAAASLVVMSMPASAQDKCFDKGTLTYIDCPKPAEPVAEAEPLAPPPPSWTGFYAGAHAGYAWADMDGQVDNGVLFASENFDVDGFLAGGQIGYMYQFENNVVLGLEIDASKVWADDSVSGSIPVAGAPAFGYSADAELNWLASARARLGYAAGPIMPYLTGGVALAGWEASASGFGQTVSVDETSFGGVAGGGLEYMATENWLLRAEGLYYFFDDEATDTSGAVTGRATLDDVIVGRVGVSYKF